MADIDLTLQSMILTYSKHSRVSITKNNGFKLNRTRIGIYRENYMEHT